MKFEKILKHPKRKLIIKMLFEGDGVRKVAKELKRLYPKDPSKHVSTPTLQNFRREHMRIEGEALEKLKRDGKLIEEKREHSKVRQLSAYQEKLKEAVATHVDIRKEIREMFSILKARIELLFNKLESGQYSSVDEQNLQKYFQAWIAAIDKHAKYVDKIADHTVETTNVNITVIEDQMAVLREAVRETMMEEMSPEGQVRFLEKLDNKMKDLSYRREKSPNVQTIHTDVKALSEKVGEIDGN